MQQAESCITARSGEYHQWSDCGGTAILLQISRAQISRALPTLGWSLYCHMPTHATSSGSGCGGFPPHEPVTGRTLTRGEPCSGEPCSGTGPCSGSVFGPCSGMSRVRGELCSGLNQALFGRTGPCSGMSRVRGEPCSGMDQALFGRTGPCSGMSRVRGEPCSGLRWAWPGL